MAEPRKPFHEQVAETLIEQLKAGTAPWLKPWNPGDSWMPHNPVSGTRYRGANSVWLDAMAIQKGYDDPRWMTYKQAMSIGAQVRKGEKGTTVQYWKFDDRRPRRDENGQPVVDTSGKTVYETFKLERPRVFYATVFNAAQIDGLPDREMPELAWDRHERADRILANSGVDYFNDQGDQAFYRPHTDSIHTPHETSFDTADKYYATVLHELGHATGHPSRLDRDLSGPFGSISYAREELIAEIASLMLGDELGIGHDPGQHAAYVASWIEILENDPKAILRAASAAENVLRYVLELEHKREMTPEVEVETPSMPAPRAEMKVSREPEIDAETAERGAMRARGIWSVSQPLDGALALGRWPLSIQGIREQNWATWVVPLHDAEGQIWSLLSLEKGSGNRLGYEPDTRTDGCFFVVGSERGVRPLEQSEVAHHQRVYLAADVLSAGAIWAATAHPVVVTFSPENMQAVGEIIKNRLPDRELVLFADVDLQRSFNDRMVPDSHVETTAKALNAMIVTPELSPDERVVGYNSFYEVYGLHGWQGLQAQIGEQVRQLDQPLKGPQAPEAEPRLEHPTQQPPAAQPPRIAEEKTYLNVPYQEKELAKPRGARWDKVAKSWYAPEGTDLVPLSRWLPEQSQEPDRRSPDPRVEFGEALRAAGLRVEGMPVMDGEMHRVPVAGGSPGSRDGAYVGYLDATPAGYIQNHKTGVRQNWKMSGYVPSDSDKAHMMAEAEQKRQARETARQGRHEQTATALATRWTELRPAEPTHAYLQRKGVAVFGVMQNEHESLLVSIRDVDGKLWSAQSIDASGDKRFAPDSRKRGCFHLIGERKPGQPILIAEGYATAATIHTATGRSVVVAFDSANLKPVAEALRQRYPKAPILICGDTDHHLVAKGKDDVGRTKATEAAQAVGGDAVFPTFKPSELRDGPGCTDFNDLARSRSLEVVQRQIEAGVVRLVERKQAPGRGRDKSPQKERGAKGAELTI